MNITNEQPKPIDMVRRCKVLASKIDNQTINDDEVMEYNNLRKEYRELPGMMLTEKTLRYA